MKLSFSIVALLALTASAAVPVDLMLNWDMAARGALDATTALASTTGTQRGWVVGDSRWSVVEALDSFSYPAPVTLSNVTLNGGSTNWLKGDLGAGAVKTAALYLGAAESSVTNLAVFGFVRIDAATNDTPYLDAFEIQSVGGCCWSILQIRPGTLGADVLSHAQTNGASGYGGTTSISHAKTYFFQHTKRDGVSETKVYDPSTGFSLVGSGLCPVSPSDANWIFFQVGYSGNVPGSIWFGNLFMLYEPSDSEISAALGQSQSTRTIGTLRVENLRQL